MDENEDMDEDENEGTDVEESYPEKEISFSGDYDDFGLEPNVMANTTSKMAIKKAMP